ncbi:MAG: penicillin-binding protein 2 [Bryobacteraceae bacterium]|nr:penicillin-binding protein 2 [Bryobacteraceae bacterium]
MNLFPRRRSDHDHMDRPLLADDTKEIAAKLSVFHYAALAVFVFLLTGFWDLQVVKESVYAEAAERNRIRSRPIHAPRGKILDRDGRVIVDNHSTFSLLLSREYLKDEHLKPIAEGLNLDPTELRQRLDRYRKRPRYEPIVIKEELSPGDIAFVEAHRGQGEFPEMELIHTQRRLYPRDGLAAHVIGYVGEISEAELDEPEYVDFKQGDIVGKDGIEKRYNAHLSGIDGQRRVLVDNLGNERQVLENKEAVPGQPLQLTLDLDLQAVAELAMEGRRGAVVALDPRNGEVLAMVSRPAFDPNAFAGRIPTRLWREINLNPDRPLFNRAVQAQLAPGSTFKPIMALAGLETGAIGEGFGVTCPGGANWYGRYFKCHSTHGRVELHRAIAQSCDVYFYALGNKMGIDTIAKYASMTGLGSKTGIDLPHEAAGLVPSSAWKMKTYRQKWFAGETISVSIGQGALIVTPLQLASAIGGIATGGVWQKPHLVREKGAGAARKAELNLDNVTRVVYGMYGVVNEGGTGARARIPGVEVCGKTGTAQLASNDFLRTAAGRELKDTAWFVGFAGKSSPELVVVAMFEAGLHGNLAAPIVRDVMKAHFDKKARFAPPEPAKTLARSFAPWALRPEERP